MAEKKREKKEKDGVEGRLVTIHSNLSHPKSNHSKYIHSHHFNQKLEVFIANDKKELNEDSSTNDYFYAADVPIHYFIEESFLQRYIIENNHSESKQLTVMTLNTPSDQFNSFCICPNGKLHISVNGEVYSELGIDGKKSHFPKSKKTQLLSHSLYRITIDLKAKNFHPGKKFYDRVMWCLKDRIEPLHCIYHYYLNGKCEEINFGEQSNQLNIKRFKTNFSNLNLPSIKLPKFNDPFIDENMIDGFVDWVGVLSCNISRFLVYGAIKPTKALSSFDLPIEIEKGAGKIYKYEGLLSSHFILNKFNIARTAVEEGASFAMIKVSGFVDSLVSWNDFEHHNLHGIGENDYFFVLLPDGNYSLFTSLGPYDLFS